MTQRVRIFFRVNVQGKNEAFEVRRSRDGRHADIRVRRWRAFRAPAQVRLPAPPSLPALTRDTRARAAEL